MSQLLVAENYNWQLKSVMAVLLVFTTIALTGYACNVQNTVNTINSILTEVGPAIQIIVSLLPLLSGKNIPPDVITAINKWTVESQADVNNLNSIIQQYQSSIASSPDVQAKINAAIQQTEQHVLDVLQIIHVLDPATQQKITSIVNAIGASIIEVEGIIAHIEGKTQLKVGKVGGSPFLVKDGKDFKKKFNAVLHTPVNDATVDSATAKLSLK